MMYSVFLHPGFAALMDSTCRLQYDACMFGELRSQLADANNFEACHLNYHHVDLDVYHHHYIVS
jgi:hypothetical protein